MRKAIPDSETILLLMNFALDHVREAIFLIDAEARFQYANDYACQLLGYRADELLRMGMDDICASVSPEIWRRGGHALKNLEPGSMQVEFGTRNGDLVPVEINFIRAVRPGRNLDLVIARDFSVLKRMEDRLNECERNFMTLTQNYPDAIVRYDRQYRRIFTNPAYEKLIGASPGHATNKTPAELWIPTNISPEQYQEHLRYVMESGKSETILLEWRTAEGRACSHLIGLAPEYDNAGTVCSVIAIGHDISEQRNAELKSHQREMYLRTLLDNFPFMVWLKDTNSVLLAANTAYARIAGVATTHDLEGKTDFDFFPPNLAQEYIDGDREAMRHDHPIGKVTPIRGADGESYWIESYKSALRVDDEVVGTVGYARDITESVKKEQEFRSLVENSPNIIVRYDKDCRRVFMNSRIADYYDVPQESILGTKPSEFPGDAASFELERHIREVLADGVNHDFNLPWQGKNHQPRISNIRLVPEFDAEGRVISVLGVGHDVTEAVEHQKRIQHLAYYDALTDLPNRLLLIDRVNQTLAEASRYARQFALMLLDLDHFKEVNDTLGHAVGDRLLCEAANRLQGCVRTYDTVARLGGDEFAILLPKELDESSLSSIAHKIVSSFTRPFQFPEGEFFVSASLGIATFPADSTTMEGLLKHADSAMYHAKECGRNNFQFYSKNMTARATERIRIEAALRKALQKSELELFFQPQVELLSGRIIGAEALLRWHSKNRIIPPDQFIPIAERSGLILDIGAWVIDNACHAAARWNRDGDTPLTVSVNLSTRQFIQNDLVGAISRTLRESGCSPAWLKLEITESLLLEDNENIRAMLRDIGALGLSISIDDFGTGYSALSYLNRFAVSQLKIDRSFIQNITTERDKARLVQAIVSMAETLEKELVAEGVETREQADHLIGIGCRQAQGYLFGKPMPLKDFESLLAQNNLRN